MRTNRLAVYFLIAALAGVATLTTSMAGQIDKNDRQAQAALQAAVNKEHVDGDLDAAIKQYKEVVSKYANQRAVAADALVHMAEAYQKLGDAESQKVYQRIVSEYGDQKNAVALARVRLGGPAAASTNGDRPVWTGPNVDLYGRVSPDGKFITYTDWGTGRLMLHDVKTKVDRALTPPAPDSRKQAWQVEKSVISRDGKQVLYLWYSQGRPTRFRIAPLQGSGYLDPHEIVLANNDVQPVGSFDLSPDGKWIAAEVERKGGTLQIALIAVADGSLRVLKSIDGSRPWGIFFSPNSRYIAYASTGKTQERDVFVLATDGSGEIAAGVHSAGEVMGWSPDGARLLFNSNQGGSNGLWALRFADGKSQGDSELLKPDIGSSDSLGPTASGALYVFKTISTRDIVTAPIDLAAGKLLGPPVGFTQGFLDRPRRPTWSPDRKYLAYPACNNTCVAIRSVATGQVRQLRPALGDITFTSWSPDGRSVLAGGKDLKNRSALVQIDAQTGEPLLSSDAGNQAYFSPDGKIKMYFNRAGVLVERDLASGAEHDVKKWESAVQGGDLSPDGQYFSAISTDPSAKSASLMLAPVAAGQPRELLRLTQPEVFATRVWTSDSSALIFQKNTGSGWELWLAPVTGGLPRKLDINPNMWMEGAEEGHPGDQTFSLSPDGHNFAFHMGKVIREVWALENFLPVPTAKK